MKAYIHVSGEFSVEVDVKNHPNYVSEIIVGGQRLTLYGVKRKDVSSISIFPGVKTLVEVRIKDNIDVLVGTIKKSNLGLVLIVK